MARNSGSIPFDEKPASSLVRWRWLVFPIFWTVVYAGCLAANTLGVVTNHAERVYGWRGLGLVVLLIATLGAYLLLTWRRNFHEGGMSIRFALCLVFVQLLSLALLTWRYESAFGWLSVALLYQVIGGLPRRQWALPLAGVLLVLTLTVLSVDGTGAIDIGIIISGIVLVVINGSIALFMHLLFQQRDQLRVTVEQLRQAHAQLATTVAQGEELAVLRERTRLARAMHDNIGHALVVMSIKLEAAQMLYARDRARGDAELEATRSLIRATMADLRHALADLRAPGTPHADLLTALEQQVRELQARAGITVTCTIASGLPTPPAETREALWYVAREALTNLERHAAATSAGLTLVYANNGWLLEVADNGRGVQPADLHRPEHYGVVGMRERIEAVGGSLDIRSTLR